MAFQDTQGILYSEIEVADIYLLVKVKKCEASGCVV